MRKSTSKSKNKSSRRISVIGVVAACSINYGRDALRGIMRYANLHKDWLVHVDPWDTTGRHIEQFPETDGAIYAGGGDDVYELLLSRSRHMVSCEASHDPARTPVVSPDEPAVGAMAAEHLIDCGYKHFAYYGLYKVAPRNVSNQRCAGFVELLKSKGHECDVCPVPWPTGDERMTRSHRRVLIKWLTPLPKPVGIMCTDDTLAFDLAAAVRETDFKIPDDIAIIGVNNDDLLCESASPPLSSVEVDWQRVGYEGAKLLDLMLRGKSVPKSKRHIQLSPLGIRQRVSTSHLALDDKDLAAAVRFIYDHACDPCGVRDVLEHVPVARRWLERQFVEKIGRTPYEEIMRVRIEQSKRMLVQLDLSVDDIALRCGYTATSNFNRAFRKVTGSTPASFRRRSRSSQRPEADEDE